MRKCLFLFSILTSFVADAQTIRTPGSFGYARLTAYSHRFTDAFSFSGNLGALPATQSFSAGVYSERRFGLKELSTHAAAFVLPTSSGAFGLKGDYFGGPAYNESSLGLAYGRPLGSKVAIGVQFNYFAFTAAGYGAASAINFDAGLMIHLTQQLNAGLQACNPVGTSWGKDGAERLPTVYRAGLGYDASDQVFVGVEAEKVENAPLGINAGLQYAVATKLLARAGFHSGSSVYYLGFGVKLRGFRLDVTASVHPYLGLSPGLLLLYSTPE